MKEMQIQFLGLEDLLEKKMATHFSILAWEIQWTEESGRSHSMGLQRVRHDWVTELTYNKCHTINAYIRKSHALLDSKISKSCRRKWPADGVPTPIDDYHNHGCGHSATGTQIWEKISYVPEIGQKRFCNREELLVDGHWGVCSSKCWGPTGW